MSRHVFAVRVCAQLTAALLLCCVFAASAQAGPANPALFVLSQPDGTQFTARAVGDEWSNGTETLDRYAILQDPSDNYWKYADQGPGGALVLTPLIVARDAPTGLQQGLRAARSPLAPANDTAPVGVSAVGTRPTLVILAQFGDKAGVTTPIDWQAKFFGATNSVKNHYQVSSYNQMTIAPAAETHGTANDGIVGWVTVSANHPNTADSIDTRNQQVTKDAILAADPYVNFAAYDTNGDHTISPSELMVIVIVAGNERSFGGASSCSPSVWGHKWQISSVPAPVVDGTTVGATGYAQFGEMHCAITNPPGQIATIGIMAHEMGHLLGLPDLYDTDLSSRGIGEWSLMSYGSWNGLVRAGDSPSLLDAWSKASLAFVTPTLVTGTLTNQSILAATSSSTVFQILPGSALTGTGEYFLVENRQKLSYDAPLKGSGLLIWHIEESRSGNSSECVPGGSPVCSSTVHLKVALIQADNLFNLERNQNAADAGDPFPGSTNKTSWNGSTSPNSNLWSGAASNASVNNISPSSSSMTATLSNGAVPPPPPVITLHPSNVTVVVGQIVMFTAGASGTPTPTAQWQVSTNGGSSFSNIGGATGSTYSFTAVRADNGKRFRAAFTNTGGTTTTNSATLTVRASVPGDIDGDGLSDLVVWRPGSGMWLSLSSSGGYNYSSYFSKQWGTQTAGDIPMLADVDGDGKADLIVWRPSTGTWYWLTSSSGYDYAATGSKQWGSSGDIPLVGDVDGDGKADLILWRPSTGTWFWLTSKSGYDYASFGQKQWGDQIAGDVPKVGDVDGDGKADLIVWRAPSGNWYWLTSASAYDYAAAGSKQWGSAAAGDVPFVGDLEGDGKVDLVVWRAPTGTWYWLTSASGYDYAAGGSKQWGSQAAGDVPLLPDLDGDGKADLVVWREPSGTWFWVTSSTGYNYATAQSKAWGASGDLPMSK